MMARNPMSSLSPAKVVAVFRLAMFTVEPVATLSQRSLAPFTSVPHVMPAPVFVVLVDERRPAQRDVVVEIVEVLKISGTLANAGLRGAIRLPLTNPFICPVPVLAPAVPVPVRTCQPKVYPVELFVEIVQVVASVAS